MEKEQFRHLGIQMGRLVNPDLIWRAAADIFIECLQHLCGIFLSTYDASINIYCYTKILYLDKIIPAKDEVIRRIEEAAVRAIAGKASLKVKEVIRPREMGGFGLRPLALHLQCTRAGWVADLLGNRWREQLHYGSLRLSLLAKSPMLIKRFFRRHPHWPSGLDAYNVALRSFIHISSGHG